MDVLLGCAASSSRSLPHLLSIYTPKCSGVYLGQKWVKTLFILVQTRPGRGQAETLLPVAPKKFSKCSGRGQTSCLAAARQNLATEQQFHISASF